MLQNSAMTILPMVAVMGQLAHGFAFQGAMPTRVVGVSMESGFSPKTTSMPEVLDLRKRALAPQNTCGWADGLATGSIYCSIGRTCMFYTPSAKIGMAGCCLGSDYGNCGWISTCYGYDDIPKSCSDDSCQSNQFNLLCSNSQYPHCLSRTWPIDGVQGYSCAQNSFSTWETIERSVVGLDRTTSSVSPQYIPVANLESYLSSASGTYRLSSTSTSTASDSNKKGTPVGAIVGGVIGGIVLIIAIVAGIIFGLHIRKKKRNAAASQNPNAQYAHHNGPPPPGSQPMTGNGQVYYPPNGNNDSMYSDNKLAPNPTVQNYQQSPMSSPGSPMPPSYNNQHPPMVQELQAPVEQSHSPANVGGHMPPNASPPPQQQRPVYEIGS